MKKSILYSVIVAMSLFVFAAMITACGSKGASEDQKTEESVEGDSADDVVYACPMHPEITGKKGDKCSQCNMALEEVKAASDSTGMHDHSH